MKIDPADMFATGFGWALRQIFLFLAAVWIGSTLGAFAFVGGVAVDGGGDTEFLLFPPKLLFSAWLFLNAFIMAAALFIFTRSDYFGFAAWGIFAGLESLMALLGYVGDLEEWYSKLTVWGLWLVLIGMMSYGLWVLRQWQRNKWAGEIAMLHAENEMRKAELRARGIATFDRDPD